MIEFYTADTPNGHKGRIMLEEVGLDYNLHAVDLGKLEFLEPEFLKISPTRRVPVIQDPDGPDGGPVTVLESGVIMTYLADKVGSSLYPTDPARRRDVDQWALHGQATFGPLLSQSSLFESRMKEDVPAAKAWYGEVGRRLYQTIDLHLADNEYFSGDYSIADIAHFTYAKRAKGQNIDLQPYAHVRRWLDQVGARPAVQAGIQAL
jgi:GST-like protein